MYRYDEYDQSIVDSRVEEFRDQVQRRLTGHLTEDQFKPLRLMNGLYLQLHAYMLRVAVPYGTLDSRQMHMLATIARTYDRGYGHFTTRQNIQYNWIKLEQAPDILADLATVEMHAIQTSGNCIRNISSDQFAGAAADEVTDPRPWAELLRQWSTFHPEFSYLPRKFKFAVIASDDDRAAMRLHDIGIQLVRRDREIGAKVFVGGGMGRTPMIASLIGDFVPAADIISYVEACLRVYNRHGPARQYLQGADQDPCPRSGRRRIPPSGRGGVRAHQAARHRSAGGRTRPHHRDVRTARVRCRCARHDRSQPSRFRGLARSERPRAQGAGLCDRDDQPEAGRRHPRRRLRPIRST